ncbi:MAG: 16S rRNA (guanine(966)-N(2))-methyltransferase RsmD [Bifidobacteriaceae bacterium]|jgi:16S rRNA (guanine966-N2)-methyltransferase|nr:16S rRNA (guanine(966)-N(2))-methyltransferase RsmD [Bifidobacteriaceae bacterium]
MTRIIAGSAGGRRLAVPAGSGTRPTSDRVREALFSAVEARLELAGSWVLDLFCGSGALGLEAVSRGAKGAVLVDSGASACRAARDNARTLGLEARVVKSPVERAVARGFAEAPFGLILADPPYAYPDQSLQAVLAGLAAGGLAAAGGLVVVERAGSSPEPAWPAGWGPAAVRRYGDTAVWLVDVPARERTE